MTIVFFIACNTNEGTQSSSQRKHQEERNTYWEIPIYNTEILYYKNGTVSRKIHFISNNNLDGFWESYSTHGDLGRTQLYLNHKVDTSWEWSNNVPVHTIYNEDRSGMISIMHDSMKLKNYVKSRIEEYQNDKKN